MPALPTTGFNAVEPNDRALFLADFGVPVVYGANQAYGILDQYDEGDPEPDADRSALGRFITLIVQQGALGALVQNTAITVNGVAMTLTRFDRLDDGAFLKLWCQA